MTDLSKMVGKFGLQKIIDEVKAVIAPAPIPEAAQGDPVGYCLAELSKLGQEIADNHTKQADVLARFSAMLGNLHQELNKSRVTPTATVLEDAAKDSPNVATDASSADEQQDQK